MSAPLITAPAADGAVVPVELPPLEPPPVRTWPVHWLTAPLVAPLVLFFPRRLGPHLAASGWRAALVVGLAASVATPLAGLLAVTLWDVENDVPGPRDLIASLTLWVLASAQSRFHTLLFVAGITVASLAGLAGAVVTSLLLMPWLSASERGRHLFGRTLRLAAWSTAALPPLVFVVTNAVLGWHALLGTSPWWDFGLSAGAIRTTPSLAAAFVWLRTLLRLGERYGGPAAGPGFVPHEPRCEECGYRLALQPLSGRCPECGRPVAESLSQRRRTPRETAGRFFTLTTVRTAWALLWDRRPGDHVSVHHSRPFARRFAVRVCLLLGLIGGTASFPVVVGAAFGGDLRLYIDDASWSYGFAALSWLLACLVVAAACFTGTALVTWLVSWAGWRQDAARRCVAVCYATPRLVVPVLLCSLTLSLTWLISNHRPFGRASVPLLGERVPVDDLAIAAAVLPALVSLVLWLFHVARLLRATRYANA